MPKLTKRPGQVTIIKGIAGSPAIPAYWVKGGTHTVWTPGYWTDPVPLGVWKTLPAHWEYTTYITVLNPEYVWYSGEPIPGTTTEISSLIPMFIQIPNEYGPRVWMEEVPVFYPYPKIWHNATSRIEQVPDTYIPGRAAVPGTPDRIITEDVTGWNSWARSINPITKGNFFSFSVAHGVRGAFCCLGNKSMIGQSIKVFPHAMAVDASGVKIYEYGSLVNTIRGSCSNITDMRIIRQDATTIIYMVITGAESLIHTSTVPASIAPLYGFGYLYGSGDSLLSSAITTGQVQFGSA